MLPRQRRVGGAGHAVLLRAPGRRGLPVLRIRNWSAVTPAFLDREWEKLMLQARAGEVSWSKVYFPYWMEQYTAHIRGD